MIKKEDFALAQSGFVLSDYLTEENFSRKVDYLFSCVFTETKKGERWRLFKGGITSSAGKTKAKNPVLVVFPELTGLWIPVLTGLFKNNRRVKENTSEISKAIKEPSLSKVIFTRITRTPLKALLSFITGQKFSFAFYDNWKESYRIWITPFLEAAKRYNTYVCPGSMFMPPRDWEVSQGEFVASKGIYNTSLLINPKGKVIGVSRKVNITADEKKLGIKEGKIADLFPFNTEIGKVGILVCLDGFYDSLAARMDNLGCELVIQPSANPREWKQIPRKGAEVTQEEEWLSSGIGELIQDRENIVYALNPMGVSSVFDHKDEGRSSAWVNLSLADTHMGGHTAMHAGGQQDGLDIDYRKYKGLFRIAESYDKEEVVYGGF